MKKRMTMMATIMMPIIIVMLARKKKMGNIKIMTMKVNLDADNYFKAKATLMAKAPMMVVMVN